MVGWRFSEWIPKDERTDFEKLLGLFNQLLMMSGGNANDALTWLTDIDRQYGITSNDYGISDFVKDLIDKGLLQLQPGTAGEFRPTSKMNLQLRKAALKEIFGKVKKTKTGKHDTGTAGISDQQTSGLRPYSFGDKTEDIAFSESFRNAQINHGPDNFMLTQDDLEVRETLHQSRMSTVLMIDISHSMILYGEDRITPAKKVAMALAEMITTQYKNDSLDIIVFGNDAWEVSLKDLPYLEVGPYHTNTVAGLELAIDLLRKRKNPNKQIFMITDGKPTCLKKGKKYYKNSWGLDRQIINRTLGLAVKCRKLDIPVTTFMIANDPWLVSFVEKFTEANRGKAFYSNLDGLGDFIFADYHRNKKKRF